VRARAALALGAMGDSESVEALVSALRHRALAGREAKAALAALGALGDVRAVPDILHALIENWGGPLPAEALQSVGIAALEPTMSLVASRPDLAQRKSLQDVVLRLTSSKQAGRLLSKRLAGVLDTPGAEDQAMALLKLAAESEPLRESLARQVLTRVTAPSGKGEKVLARAAQQALEKRLQPARDA
jgi:PBS lyase HEAT-like repeat